MPGAPAPGSGTAAWARWHRLPDGPSTPGRSPITLTGEPQQLAREPGSPFAEAPGAVRAWVDRERTRNVLINVVENAYDAMMAETGRARARGLGP